MEGPRDHRMDFQKTVYLFNEGHPRMPPLLCPSRTPAVRRVPSMIPVARALVLGGVLTLLGAGDARAVTWFVHGTEGIDSPTGGGPDYPFRTIQFAVDAAGSGDTILVAA